MNIFRISADVSHTISKLILMWVIHYNSSAEGVSLMTQILYIMVFCSRYLNIFTDAPSASYWNFVLKIFYVTSSVYIVFLMMKVFPRTREKEEGWRLGVYALIGSVALAPIVTLIQIGWTGSTLLDLFRIFSLILESVCVLPQLLLLRQTTVPTVIDSFYLITLGSYRGFYILNWILREFRDSVKPDHVSVLFGIVQTALYLDFAWVYWTRQRVKLRGGGIVDADDLNRGWLVSRILNRKGAAVDEEERASLADEAEDGDIPAQRRPQTWGARGISVSAEDTLPKITRKEDNADGAEDLTDPLAFEDEDDDDDDSIPPVAVARKDPTELQVDSAPAVLDSNQPGEGSEHQNWRE